MTKGEFECFECFEFLDLIFEFNSWIKFLNLIFEFILGDNNNVDDRGLYAPGQYWLARKDIVGRARGYLPYVGYVTIMMNDYPMLKYAVLACLGIYALIHRE